MNCQPVIWEGPNWTNLDLLFDMVHVSPPLHDVRFFEAKHTGASFLDYPELRYLMLGHG